MYLVGDLGPSHGLKLGKPFDGEVLQHMFSQFVESR